MNASEQLFAIDSLTRDPGPSYLVRLKGQPSCTCPHFTRRLAGTGAVCKHIDAVRLQSSWLLAAAKARNLSDALLTDLLVKHRENPVVAGALMCERHRRRQEAAAQDQLRAVFA